jgi:hypothetical protein
MISHCGTGWARLRRGARREFKVQRRCTGNAWVGAVSWYTGLWLRWVGKLFSGGGRILLADGFVGLFSGVEALPTLHQ